MKHTHKLSQNNKPLITVITVVYNAEKTLEETVNSVINQIYENIEYIIIDGASSDNTVEIIKKYEDNIDYWISEPDEGVFYAMNKGIDRATGDWIIFMNSGDTFTDNLVLDRIFNDTIYTNIDIIYGNGIEQRNSGFIEKKAKKNIKYTEWGAAYRHGASFVKTTVHKEYKFAVEKSKQLGFSLDFECIYRLYQGNKRFHYIDINIMTYDMRSGLSMDVPLGYKYVYLITNKKLKLLKWCLYKLRLIKNCRRKAAGY
jgi:glycosyltransferase involved in cell wall biosynthesis